MYTHTCTRIGFSNLFRFDSLPSCGQLLGNLVFRQMEGMRGSSYTLCETFCILEFSRKLAVKSAYPRVLSAKNLTGGKLRPDRHAVDPYAPLPLPLSLRFPLSFEESSRSYLNSPSTTLSRLPGYPFCAFLPPSYLLWISPSLSLDRRGEVYRRLKPRSSLPTATTANRGAGRLLFPLCRR